MKSVKSLFACAALVAVSACQDFSSPKGVLGTAATALQKNNIDDFRKTLTPNGVEKYGDEASFLSIQSKLKPYKKLNVASQKVVRAERGDQGLGHHGDVLREYSVDVQAGRNTLVVFNADVVCTVSWYEYDNPGTPDQCHSLPNGGQSCTPGTPPSHSEGEAEHCLIDQVTFI